MKRKKLKIVAAETSCLCRYPDFSGEEQWAVDVPALPCERGSIFVPVFRDRVMLPQGEVHHCGNLYYCCNPWDLPDMRGFLRLWETESEELFPEWTFVRFEGESEEGYGWESLFGALPSLPRSFPAAAEKALLLWW